MAPISSRDQDQLWDSQAQSTSSNKPHVLYQSQRLAAKAARAGSGQRSGSDRDDSAQLLGPAGNGSGGADRHGGLASLPDPSAWAFASALRGDSIADGDERHLQVTQPPRDLWPACTAPYSMDADGPSKARHLRVQ